MTACELEIPSYLPTFSLHTMAEDGSPITGTTEASAPLKAGWSTGHNIPGAAWSPLGTT